MAIDTPTPAQQLEEVLALLEKATPAPWTMDERDIIERTGAMLGIYIARPNGTRILETFANCGIDDEACEANAALIVSLVNAAPLLRRALAALEAVEWRPIETAPKDGQMFLGWVSAERWSQEDGGGSGRSADTSEVDFCQWRGNDGNGYFDNMMGQIGDMQDITHWMPLPAPPADAVEVKS